MKLLPKYIWLLILVLFPLTVSARDSKGFSEWSFQNRETGKYFYENNGVCKFGQKVINDSYLWIIESTKGEEILIKNKKSGHYLQIIGDHLICGDAKKIDTDGLKWKYRNFDFVTQQNCGWYTLSNCAAPDLHLMSQNNNLVIGNSDRNIDFNSHWTVVREKGSPLSYYFTPEKVLDASFLGLREAKAVSNNEIISDYHGVNHSWKLKKDISSFPQLKAENNKLLVALYNMALEEMLLDIRSDSTFMAGALWPDTWTRDAVYSIYFSYAWVLPDISRKTLEKQTLKNPKEALQDTGSGGSWPISTDRVVWALAAWEYYLSTGDEQWLKSAYEGLKYTAMKDIHVAFDSKIGLFKGETCSMDWRTHTYPNWFTNATISQSFSCGTNVLHMNLYKFLGDVSRILNQPTDETILWDKYYNTLKNNINLKFWDNNKKCYTCYLYPEYFGYRSSDRVDVMSNGLSGILGTANQEQVTAMVENFPLYQYGAPTLYPTIPDDFAYHNKGIWPVWETPYMYAARDVKNTNAVEHIVKSLMRQSALFLTHKENMTYDTGYDRGTALSSDRQLWSVASYISMIYRVLFGISMTQEGITFNPVIPSIVNGKISLENFHYRDAIINISISGNGNNVKSLSVNGQPQTLPYTFSTKLIGTYKVEMVMETVQTSNKINLVNAGPGKCWSPVEPVLNMSGKKLEWNQESDLQYFLHSKSISTDQKIQTPFDMIGKSAGFYSIYAIDAKGFQSDLSNPVLISDWGNKYTVEKTDYKNSEIVLTKENSNSEFAIDYCSNPTNINFTIDLPANGNYAITLIGSNGRGPHGTYCYIRSVFVDGVDVGTFLLEATGDWNKWMNSNYIILEKLKEGKHKVNLKFNPEYNGFNNNMSHGKENYNDAKIKNLKVIKL
ncbi:MAG: carbohydrate-binding protein [Bacteroidales bacterium]|nr:carbohydrate-binding protein [Bacteroidales bacterium]